MSTIRKAMVLAAGLGTRLLPITERLPKPLVPVLNIPNVLHTLHILKRAGITDVILNIHHLKEQMQTFLGDGAIYGLKVRYSPETLLLGTGGGLKKAELFFEGESLVLVNCDFITDIDLEPIIRQHEKHNAIATMVLMENPSVQAFYSKVGVDRQGRLCSLPRLTTSPPDRTGLFTGIHVLAPEAFTYLQEVPSGINEVLYPRLMKEHFDRVYGHFVDRAYWYDTGELHHFWTTSLKLLRHLNTGDTLLRDLLAHVSDYQEIETGVWVSSETTVPRGVRFQAPVLIGKYCKLGADSTIGPYVVLGDETTVKEKAQVDHWVSIGKSTLPDRPQCTRALQFESLVLPMESASLE